MGKAARNRALKAKQHDQQRERAAIRDAVGEVLKLETYDAFARRELVRGATLRPPRVLGAVPSRRRLGA